MLMAHVSNAYRRVACTVAWYHLQFDCLLNVSILHVGLHACSESHVSQGQCLAQQSPCSPT